MTANSNELRGIMEKQFSAAKRVLCASELTVLALGVLSLLVVFVPREELSLAWAAGLLSVVLLIAERVLRYRFTTLHGEAEEIRRLFLLCDGLGVSPSAAELGRLRNRIGAPEATKDAEPYFTSSLPPGPERLLTLTWESAYWSEDLQGQLARTFFALAAVSTGGALLISLFTLAGAEGPIATKLIAPALAALVGANYWGKWREAQTAEACCKAVAADSQWRLRLPWNGGERNDLREVMQIVMRHNAVMLNAYPPSDRLYRSRQAVLNPQWQQIAAEVAAAKAP